MTPIPVIALLALFVEGCVGRNPVILPSIGLADPHVRVIDGRVHMFATHDFSVNNSDFMMRDWWVWTTDDLVRMTEATSHQNQPFHLLNQPSFFFKIKLCFPTKQASFAVTLFACRMELGKHFGPAIHLPQNKLERVLGN